MAHCYTKHVECPDISCSECNIKVRKEMINMQDRYNPKYYTDKINKVIEEAQRNGMGIEFNNGKVAVCNTVAEIKSSIDFSDCSDDLGCDEIV